MGSLNLGALNISGLLCSDYSPLGLQLGTQGPTVLVLLTFLLLVRIQKPAVMLHENVVRQPTWIFELCLKGLYHLDSIVLEPGDFGHPVMRRRRYLVASLRSLRTGRCLSDLPGFMHSGPPASDCSIYCRSPRTDPPRFAERQRENLRNYIERYPDALCCGVSQTAALRPGVSNTDGFAPVLTSTCASFFWIKKHRYATLEELGLMQGLPTTTSLSRRWYFRNVDSLLADRRRQAHRQRDARTMRRCRPHLAFGLPQVADLLHSADAFCGCHAES